MLASHLVSAHRKDEEEGEDCAAAQQTLRFVRGVAGATPQGARCVELRLGSRSSESQLEASLRRPPAAAFRLVEGGAAGLGGRAACLAGSFRPFRQSRWPRARSLA